MFLCKYWSFWMCWGWGLTLLKWKYLMNILCVESVHSVLLAHFWPRWLLEVLHWNSSYTVRMFGGYSHIAHKNYAIFPFGNRWNSYDTSWTLSRASHYYYVILLFIDWFDYNIFLCNMKQFLQSELKSLNARCDMTQSWCSICICMYTSSESLMKALSCQNEFQKCSFDIFTVDFSVEMY